jgi:hypothetical protein
MGYKIVSHHYLANPDCKSQCEEFTLVYQWDLQKNSVKRIKRLSVLLIPFACTCAMVIWRFKGHRYFFSAVAFNQLWFMLLCQFVGCMAVTNEWL